MKEIVKILLEKGIEEDTIHEVLDVIEEGRLWDEEEKKPTETAVKVAGHFLNTNINSKKQAMKQVKQLEQQIEQDNVAYEQAKADLKVAHEKVQDLRNKEKNVPNGPEKNVLRQERKNADQEWNQKCAVRGSLSKSINQARIDRANNMMKKIIADKNIRTLNTVIRRAKGSPW